MAERARSDNPRIFISYSRDDIEFADQLDAALKLHDYDITIDRQGISGGEDWKCRLENLIRDADTVVFVLSPSSAQSSICKWEVEEAVRLGKRIIPVLCQPLEGAAPPPQLADLNYIHFYRETKSPGSGFGTGLTLLVSALDTDLVWLREHTRYLQRAIEWDAGGRTSNRLLSGRDITDAKVWLGRQPKEAPPPTALHLDFIKSSEEEEEARKTAERLRLDEIAAAQDARAKALTAAEAALKREADAQRKRAWLRNALLLVMTLATIISSWFWYKINEGNKQLAEQVQLAAAAATRAKSAEREARSAQQRAQKAELDSIINECSTSSELLRINPAETEHLYNYLNCGTRLGFALVRAERAKDSGVIFTRMREAASPNIDGLEDGIRSFYSRLASLGASVARCAETAPRSAARSAAVDGLVIAANEIMQFGPPPSLEERWREELFRGYLYISNYSQESGNHEMALEYASKLVERLSMEPHEWSNAARDFVKALGHFVWMAIIAKRASQALEASNRATRLVEKFGIVDLEFVRMNRAHALLFTGHIDEARNEYRKLNPDHVMRDMEALTATGLCHPLFGDLSSGSVNCTPVR